MAGAGVSATYSDSTTNANSDTAANYNSQTATNATQTGNTIGSTAGNQSTFTATSTLDPAIQAALASAATTIGAGISSVDMTGLKNEYIRQFNEDTMGSLNQIAQTTGSQDNSFVELLKNKAQSDLATKLYGVDSSNQINLAQALSGIAGAAKGATTTTTSAQNTQTASAQNTLNQLLQDVTSSGTSASATNSTSDTSGWSVTGSASYGGS